MALDEDENIMWVASQDGTATRIGQNSGRLVGKRIDLGQDKIRGDVAIANNTIWITGTNNLIRVKP
jgi:hypothetical protein